MADENEKIRAIGTPVFFCRKPLPKRERCAFCIGAVVALCDHRKPGSRRTCSARLCEQHRTRVGPDLDVCPNHRSAEALPLGPLLHEAPRAHDEGTV